MPATNFGVIFSSGNAIIRRYVYVDDDSELDPARLCGPGESLALVAHRPYFSTAAWQLAVNNAVRAVSGIPPGDSACCVVDANNIVVQLICADAAIDTLPGVTLVQAYAPIPLGSTYDPATGLFTAPGYTIPAFPGSPTKPPRDEIIVPPTVIPKP